MKLKILHLTQFLGVGGLEKVLLLLIQEQLKAGHEVELMVYDYERSWVDYFRDQGIKVITDYQKAKGYDRKLLSFIASQLAGVDVLHTHDLNPLMYAAPLKFLKKLNLKTFPHLIHTAHGMDHLNKRPVTKIYEKLCSRMTNATIGVSSAVCDYYLKLGVNSRKVVNINNGTRMLESFDHKNLSREKLQKEFNLPPNRKIWVSVARVLPLKDQKLLCELALRLPDIELFLVGPSGDDEYWNQLKVSLAPNVHMTGARSDINELLLAADFFISASRHEGIPIAVLEAGAAAIPCVLSDIPGHQVIQKDRPEQIAVFFKAGDVNDLEQKAREMQNDEQLARSLARNLHQHVKENFSSYQMYQNYLQVYQMKEIQYA